MSLRWAQPWLPWVVPTFGRKPCSFFNACQLVVGMWSVTVLPWQQQPLGSTGSWGYFGFWRWRSSTEVVLFSTLWSKIMSSILVPIIAMQFVSWVCCHIGRRLRIEAVSRNRPVAPKQNGILPHLSLWSTLRNIHLVPNLITYNAAINACEGLHWEHALALLEAMTIVKVGTLGCGHHVKAYSLIKFSLLR